jgi:ribosomal-protein-alanine N-acetyltransferase
MNTTGKFMGQSWDELSEVIEFDRHHFPQPWKAEQWQELDRKHSLLFQLKQKELLGFALFSRVKGDDLAHLLKICLSPELRGQGLALAFWTQIVEQLRLSGVSSVFLEVEETNLRAIHFYRKIGFEPLRLIKGFYSSGAHALTMQLML